MMSEFKGYVDAQYLQTAGKVFEPIKLQSYELMRICPGHIVLDVGCGPGIDTTVLSTLVGPQGHVIGIDYDATMIFEAEQKSKQQHAKSNIKHLLGNAVALPFRSESFNACRGERLFLHLEYPDKTMAELVRVTKTAGWIVVVDTDAATVSFDTTETDIEYRLLHFRAEHLLNNGYAGRQLYRLFKKQDLKDVSVKIIPVYVTSYTLARYLAGLDETEEKALEAGVIDKWELERWHTSLECTDRENTFFASVCMVMVAGQKG